MAQCDLSTKNSFRQIKLAENRLTRSIIRDEVLARAYPLNIEDTWEVVAFNVQTCRDVMEVPDDQLMHGSNFVDKDQTPTLIIK